MRLKQTTVEELNTRIEAYIKWHTDLAKLARAYRESCKLGTPVETMTLASNELLDHAFNAGLEP